MCGDCNWPLDDKIQLSEEDAKAFLEALANPPPPNEKFKEAYRKYHEMDQS